MKSKARKILIHIATCCAFLLLPFISMPRSSFFNADFNFGPMEIKGVINSALLILFFYFNYYYIIPEVFRRKKYYIWIIITLLSFIVIILLPQFIVTDFKPLGGHFNPPPDGFRGHENHRPMNEFSGDRPLFFFMRDMMFQESLLKFILVLVFSFLLQINSWWKKTQEEKRAAELSYLKSQVNPHFLYNTLNGIYALALNKSAKTPEAIIQLSELMRYVTDEIKNDFVPLHNEIQYISHYIELQKIRLEDTVSVVFEADETDNESPKIAPLLLIPFVENAFKYTLTNNEKAEIKIAIHVNEKDELYFTVRNHIHPGGGSDSRIGTGIENVKRRLELTYPQAYNLLINKDKHIYVVELKLKLKK
jgi:hypothetical protein